ncbi:MAG: carbon storage regulator [Defluviitaleaceae bacterium]|nr:carbon storage regulator [Defluviitaleaceae bacterium]
MLLTTLGAGDYIMLGNDVVVHFDHKIDDNNISIAVEAPKNVSVLRKKLFEAGVSLNNDTDSTEISRFLVTLNAKEDYVMIGKDIQVKYKGNKGHSFSIGVSAPRDIKITLKSTYEKEIEQAAQQGDYQAQIIADMLTQQALERKRLSAQRKVKQQKHKQNHAKQKTT